MSLPNAPEQVDGCEQHIQQLKYCFKWAVDDLDEQIKGGVVSPSTWVPIYLTNGDVNTVPIKNCQRRVDAALVDYIQGYTLKPLQYKYRGIVVKPVGEDDCTMRKVHIVQGETYVGTTLAWWFTRFWP